MRHYNSRMSVLRVAPIALFVTTLAVAQHTVSFPTEDGGHICADLYGQGTRAVVLAHGGRFNKESWGNKLRTWHRKDLKSWPLIFAGSAVRPVLDNRTLTVPPLQRTCLLRFAT